MTTPKYANFDTGKPDGCYVTFEKLEVPDEDFDPNDYLFQDEEYRDQDQARLDAFNRGEWYGLGIRARAHVRRIENGRGTYFSIDSPGLWGIESDSDLSYFDEVYQEEIAELKTMLSAMQSYQIEEE